MIKCLICQREYKNERSLATHIQITHKIKSEEYTIKYILNGIEPKCAVCETTPRYCTFTYKKYCKNHSYMAESEAGYIGGKIKQTWNKGQTKKNNEILLQQSIGSIGEKNPFYGKKLNEKTQEQRKEKIRLTEEEYIQRTESRKKDFNILTPYKKYFSKQKQYLETKCNKCNNIEYKTLVSLERGTMCNKCFPKGSSIQEQEVKDFITSLNIEYISNDRKIISPKEIDIYIPSKNFAIEYNGLFWHSGDKIDKKKHIEKTKECHSKNIQLFHVYSDEWINKQDIIKSMIKHRLNISDNIIFARKCEIREVISKEASLFYDKTHISGKSHYRKSFGLYYKDELVSLLAFKVPIQKKYGSAIEIVRFSNKLNTSVVGGFSKLFKKSLEWVKKENYQCVVCYADLRFGQGKVYLKNNFQFIGNTSPGYWYTDGKKRYFRFKFRAQPGKPEKQVAIENNVSPIYDCGHNIYLYKL